MVCQGGDAIVEQDMMIQPMNLMKEKDQGCTVVPNLHQHANT